MIRTGSTLGDYEILGPVGRGGMGEVWRARDTKLGRQVAIKLLPQDLALDRDRLARFEREARVLAALNHPGIATLYGFHTAVPSAALAKEAPPSSESAEEANGYEATIARDEPPRAVESAAAEPAPSAGVPFLAMELVEGETLGERIRRSPIPLEEVVRLALAIARALEAAHEQGIVHRDLKPANIKVTPDGGVKVLDFGLAKALALDTSASVGNVSTGVPTLTQITEPGALLGTAGYMSPEQARARPVDHRADIWAFGCVLFEMLAGRKAFEGETATDLLGAIVHKEPDLALLPASTPTRVAELVEHCLRKEPERRLQAIGDARITLEDVLARPQVPGAADRRPARWLPIAAAALIAGGIGLATGFYAAPKDGAEPTYGPLRQFTETLKEEATLAVPGAPVFSPDGRRLAYVIDQRPGRTLYVRSLERETSVELASSGNPTVAPMLPFFSPDGEWVGYAADGALKKVAADGGAPITLAPAPYLQGASWGADDRIVFSPAPGSGLQLVSGNGGTVETLLEDDEDSRLRYPQWLPDGRAVLCTVMALGEGAGNRIEAVRLETGERTLVEQDGQYARYVPSGHIVFARGNRLLARRFDAEALTAVGEAVPVREGVASFYGWGLAGFDVSADGTLAYVPTRDFLAPYPVHWIDREGRTEALWAEESLYGTPRLSPDGTRLAVSRRAGTNWDIWIYDLGRGVSTRLTRSPEWELDHAWSPDGSRIAFAAMTKDERTYGIRARRADGSGEEEILLAPDRAYYAVPTDWAPDGSRLVVQVQPDARSRYDLWLVSADGSGAVEELPPGRGSRLDGAFSPDGRHLAFMSTESGPPEIYVRSLNGPGRWQISNTPSSQPRWAPDGRALYYRALGGRLMRVAISYADGDLQPGPPQTVFDRLLIQEDLYLTFPGVGVFDYDVALDGRFVVLAPPHRATGQRLRFVTGWLGEVERLTTPAR